MKYITPEHYSIAKQNGISKQNVYQRVRNLGWSIERAITESANRDGDIKSKHIFYVRGAKSG